MQGYDSRHKVNKVSLEAEEQATTPLTTRQEVRMKTLLCSSCHSLGKNDGRGRASRPDWFEVWRIPDSPS